MWNAMTCRRSPRRSANMLSLPSAVYFPRVAPHDGSAPNAVVSARNSSLLGLLASVKSGSGVAILPKGIGEPDPELVRVWNPILL